MQRRIQVLIPKGSSNGSVIKIEGEGKEPQSDGDKPPHRGKRGNLFVNLRTYPDYIKPVYRSFESLDTDAMALEGWVYRKKDEVTSRLGYSILGIQPVDADTIADIFNEKGWEAVFHYLVNHLGLARLLIELETSDFTSTPGKCQQYVLSSNSGTFRNYKIWLSKAFLDNPFCVAAILAHELCHVVYREKFENLPPQSQSNSSKQTLEEERMVDLLVFMFKLGGFQIRVSRGSRITMGYFNQETFDRIYVILLKESEKTKRENRT